MDELEIIVPTIAHCPECDTQTQVSTYQIEFCPKCKWVCGGGFVAEVVLSCNTCREPIALMKPGLTYRCVTCDTERKKSETFFGKRLT